MNSHHEVDYAVATLMMAFMTMFLFVATAAGLCTAVN